MSEPEDYNPGDRFSEISEDHSEEVREENYCDSDEGLCAHCYSGGTDALKVLVFFLSV